MLDDPRPPLTKLKEDGVVVLERVLPRDLTAQLHRDYTARLEEKMARLDIRPLDARPADLRPDGSGAGYGGNHDFNRWNMHLPSCLPFLDSRVIANPAVMGILRAFLGDDCMLFLIASDTSLPSSGVQRTHIDSARPILTVNVPLVDVTEETGPTEVWPGTHLMCDPARPDWFKAKGAYDHLPSTRLFAPAGSIIVRDHRLLHRGTPNRSREARPMLTLLYATDEKARVPHRFLTDAASRAALSLRERGRRRRGGSNALLAFGNGLGRVIEFIAQTDRDYRRRIPAEVWEQLTPEGKHLLRFAALDEGAADGYVARRSIWTSSRFVLFAAVTAARAGLLMLR